MSSCCCLHTYSDKIGSDYVRTPELQGVTCRSVGAVGRRVDVDQLVGAAEIADRLGLSRPQVVHVWRNRYSDFPQPVYQRERAMIWDWREVELWARRTHRL